MRQRPWPLIVLAILHMLAPLGNSIFNSIRYRIYFWELWQFWFAQLSWPLLASYFLLPVLAGIFIFLCKKWSFYAYLVCILLITAGSFYGLTTSVTVFTIAFFSLFIIVDFFLVAYFMVPAVKEVYLDPRLRWWEAAPRYTIDLDVEFGDGDSGNVSNISLGGIFVKTEVLLADNIVVKFTWKWKEKEYSVDGRIVHHQLVGTHGYGVRFELSDSTREEIKDLILDLKNDGRLIVNRSNMPEMSFFDWLMQVLKTGKGLMPQKK